jgi:hypothetical protein
VLAGLEDWHVPLNPTGTAEKHSAPFVLERAEETVEALSQFPAMEHDEQFYCMRARLAALKHQPDDALKEACACEADMKAVVRLRTYLPALVAYSHQGMPCPPLILEAASSV